MKNLPTIEGFSPDMLWTTLYVLVGIGALIVLADKVRSVFSGAKERKRARKPELADEISAKVIESLEPRFEEYDRKLANDKALLENHTRQIEAINRRTDSQDAGIRALCHGMAALLDNADKCGNAGEEIKAAKKMFTDYLTDK